MAEPVVVTHGAGSYRVYVEPGAIGQLDRLVAEHLEGRRVAMIADAAVHELYRAGRLGTPAWTGEVFTFPSGEKSKTRETWSRLSDSLLERGFGRDTGLITLGGGVTGDLAGFVAATYMRGIPYLQVPTTLLAMLDASVGGKTGVDTRHGKNLIGAFHPPAAVVADPATLATLSDRAYRTGLAEAVKHGLIADQAYFEWMETYADALARREPDPLTRLIRRSVEIKAEVVSADERETGRRAILNAGHTVAHALEQTTEYQLPHGEAVAVGLVVECALAEQLGVASAGLRRRVERLLTRLGLPKRLPQGVERTAVLGSMTADKKNRGARIHFALPQRLGAMHRAGGWTIPVDADAIRAALEAVK
ncbi:MAG TPA: 3-dehydroquinate synthase [Gemmatimonadales bacterium]|nr:3-dehydroquinate synthase [Gemmatimonadales bacterium]